MILLLSDLHARFDLVNRQIDHAQRHGHGDVEAVVLLGDVGLFEPDLGRFFRRAAGRFARPTFFVEGNHEDFESLPRLVERYADVMTHLPRGWCGAVAGRRCLALGGAAYMDALSTPMGSVVTDRDLNRCLELPASSVEIILAHDCPAGVGVPSTPGFEHLGRPGIPHALRLAHHFRPRLWAFGHHHRWFDRTHDGTRYVGLPQAWEGYALIGEGAALHLVHHHIALPPSFFKRVQKRFGEWLGPARARGGNDQ